MPKTPQMERSLDALTLRLFGRRRKEGECVVCGSDKCKPEDFNNDKSRSEYSANRLCQSCQDYIWR